MKKNLFVLLSGLLVLATLSACSAGAPVALAQTEEPLPEAPLRTISVSGSGKVTLTPDIATISIGVHTENIDATEAVAANTSQAQAVMQALEAAGVAEKDIQTSNFSIYPRQEWDNEGKVTGITYVVDNTVLVTVRDLDAIGGLLEAVVEAGSNQIGGIQFDVSNREAAYKQALSAAVEDARAKADVLAQAAGVEVGDVQMISSSTSGGPIVMEKAFAVEAAMAVGEVPVSPGEMEVSAEVSIVYLIQ